MCGPGTYAGVNYVTTVDTDVIVESGAVVTDDIRIVSSGSIAFTADDNASIGSVGLETSRDGKVSLIARDTGSIAAYGSTGGASVLVRDVTGELHANATGQGNPNGDVEVQARHVTSEYGREIVFVENSYDATINIESVNSAGDEMVRTGIYGNADRDLTIEVNSVEIDHLGDDEEDNISAAIYGVAGNKLVIDVGSLEVGLLDRSEDYNASAIFASADVIEIEVDSLIAAGEPGTGGIYTFAADTAKVEARSVVFNGAGSAIYTDGTADTTVTSGTITTTGGAKGIVMRNAGDQIVNSTTITTEGDNAHGIDLSGARGKVEVTSGSIIVAGGVDGGGARGITVADTEGPVTINSTTISANGYESRGIYVDAAGGETNPIVVNGGQITVEGQYSQGIQIYANDVTAVTVTGSVTAKGEETIGVLVHNPGHTKLDMGVVSVDGEQSTGILVSGVEAGSFAAGGADADSEIHADSVRVSGDWSRGVIAEGDEVRIDLDDLQVTGENAQGVIIDQGDVRTADVTIRNADIAGANSSLATIYADESIKADFGRIRFGADTDPQILLSSVDVEATVRDMASTSSNPGGLIIEATEEATLNVGRLSTAGGSGSPSAAASIRAGGHIVVDGLDNPDGTRGGSIVTTGDGARGLDLRSEAGTIDVTLASISTTGDDASAIRVRTGVEDGPATAEKVTLDIGAITAQGRRSHGVDVIAENADITVGRVATVKGGADSISATAVKILTEGQGAVTVRAGAVSTEGDNAYGIQVESNPEADTPSETTVTVGADSVTTSGDSAHGILVRGRVANVTVGDVETTDNRANGVLVRGTDSASVTVRREITTRGVGAAGINVSTMDADDVVRGPVAVNAAGARISTEGNRAVALSATATDVTIAGGSYSTAGLLAKAIHVRATDDASLTGLGSVSTTGGGSAAVVVDAVGDITLAATSVEATGAGTTDGFSAVDLTSTGGGAITASLGTLRTAGDRTDALVASTTGNVSIEVGALTTTGENADGIRVENGDEASTTIVRTGVVNTTGSGIEIATASGEPSLTAATVVAGTVTTSGVEAAGIAVDAATADITVNSVTTTGARSAGVMVTAATRAAVTSAGTISTTGERAIGVNAFAGPSRGVVDLALTNVRTTGLMSHGVAASADTVEISAAAITTTGRTAEAVTVFESGDVTLGLGVVRAEGEGSRGVVVDASGAIDLEAVSVHTTAGVYSAQSPDAIVLDTSEGNITAAVGTIGTVGHGARGVAATAAGNVEIDVNTVSTAGEGAHGIVASARGAIDIEAGTITTTGAGSLGIDAGSDGDMEIAVREMSGRSTLIDAASGGDMTITLGRARGTGQEAAMLARSDHDLTFNVLTELSSTGGAAADLGAEGFVDFTLAQGAVVQGDEVSVRINSGEGTHVILNGTVSATSGLALDIKGGAATIDNRANTIVGRIDLTANDDVLNNAGRFTASGNSDFGAGTDVVNNTGLIELADGAGARSVSFLNLERLNNAGTLDLSNGRAGDVFSMTSGVLNGQAGNTVTMDLDLTTGAPAADRIVAGGFEGVTRVLLDVQGRGRLGETGVVIAQSGRAQTGSEVQVEVADGGFVDYSVLLSGNAFTLQGSLAMPAFEPTKIAAGAQHQWTSGADVVSARFEQMHDGGLGEGKGVQLWSQTYDGSVDMGGWRSFDIEGETVDADLNHEVKSRGVQAGADRNFGDITVGVLAGTGRTELRFRNGDRTRFDGLGLGAYGHWSRDALSIGVVAKMDQFDVDYDWAEAGMRTSADGATIGVRVDASWRANVGESWYLEPQGSLSWSDTSLHHIESDTGIVEFGDTTSLIGRVGFRAGGVVDLADGMALRPYGGLHILNEFKGDNVSRLHLEEESVLVRDEAEDAWARATVGLSVGGPLGLGAFLQAEQDFGAVEGFTARAGVRYAW